MDTTSIVCTGCGYRIEPIFVFERSPKTKKLYLITRCPKDRCNFNIDIEESTDPPKRRPHDKKKPEGGGEDGESRFGVMDYEGEFICYTLEHEDVKIPAGTYRGEIRWSERFQKNVVYIHVPGRVGIEAHKGNCPGESGGCVLVGTEVHGACLRNSKQAFERMMKVLPQDFTVVVS